MDIPPNETVIEETSFDHIKKIDWLKHANAYQMLNFIKPLCLSMLDELNNIKKELELTRNLINSADKQNKYFQFDRSAYEKDLIENGTHIRSSTGELLKITKEN